MNFSYAARPISNTFATSAAANSSAGLSGFLSRFWAVMLLVFLVFVALVIYYKTIGYYMEIGWNRIQELIFGRASVDITIGDEAPVTGSLKPMSGLGPSDERTPGLPGASNGNPVLSSLSIGGPKKEVFNVSRNIYTYNDASAVCSALGADLATYEQVQEAYERGADWCNYGWIKGQMAVYPTQKETYEKLQKGAPEYRNACGRVGMNGGHFDNPELRFGVTCFGVKPPRNATDELLESSVALPPTTDEIEYEKKVQKYRDQLNTMVVLPFKRGQWTE